MKSKKKVNDGKVALETVGKMLGHSEIKTIQIYAKIIVKPIKIL